MSHEGRSYSIVVPAVVTVAMIAVAAGLGIWQVERRAEKHALIATLNARLAAEPVPLSALSGWRDLTPETDEFRRVKFSAVVDPARRASVYGSGSALRSDVSGAGVWIFAPARLPDGRIIVVNLGFVPDASKQQYAHDAAAFVATTRDMVGYIRFPERSGWLTPEADREKHLWFVRETKEMARLLGWGDVAPFYVDVEKPVPSSGLPKPGPLQPHLRDEHLQYAITWFGLAVAIAVAFAIWVRGRRRRGTAT